MLKIGQSVEKVGHNTLVHKSFRRGLQTIDTTSAYIGDKLFFRKWNIQEHNHTRKIAQAYTDGKPVKSGKSVLDYFA